MNLTIFGVINLDTISYIVTIIAVICALPYLVFTIMLLVLVFQKLTHRNVSDEEYNFRYPFGKEEKESLPNYTEKTWTKRGKRDNFFVYIAVLLFPFYIWGINTAISSYQEKQISTEYPASWGEAITICESSIKPSMTGSVDTGKIAKDSCICRNKTRALYANNPYEYSKKYGENNPQGYDSQFQKCLESA